MPKGYVSSTAAEAKKACTDLGGKAVVKAQVYAGGRGKAGGIKLVDSSQEAYEFTSSIIGRNLVTAQTGSAGVPVNKVLVEAPAKVTSELYLALAIDRTAQGPVFIASSAGGMEIEDVASKNPEQIINEAIDIVVGVQPFQARRITKGLGLGREFVGSISHILTAMYQLLWDLDLSLLEINPLIVSEDGSLIAVDAKINIEDDALYRRPHLSDLSDPDQEDPLEIEASQAGIAYVTLDGSVGCLVNGAGLAMATMDLVCGAGTHPANFLDVGGSANEDKVAKAVDIMLSDQKVKVVLVNIFGGILRNDIVARGIVKAYNERNSELPLVVRMQGTNVSDGRQILEDSTLQVSFADTLLELEEQLVIVSK